ncbi:acyl-CoA thioesterase [Gordonia terrae]
MSQSATAVLADIVSIAPALDSVVTEDLVDANDHMSLPHFVKVGARAVWSRKRDLGLDDSLALGFSFFVSEQHTRYMSELVLGDRFTVHPIFLARSRRAVHTLAYVVDVGRQRPACIIESVSVCVSKDTRLSADIPPPLAAELDAAVRADATLANFGTLCNGLWR